MDPKLKKHWEALQEERLMVENEIGEASLPQQQFSKPPDSWNLLQVMDHLIAVEKSSFDYLIKKNYANTRRAKGKLHIFRAFFLRLMLASPLKFKVPPIPSLHPNEKETYPELMRKWEQERERSAQYLEHFPEEKRNDLIFRHPVMGWLTIEQTLAFLKDHIRHHRQQIKRIKSTTGYPSK